MVLSGAEHDIVKAKKHSLRPAFRTRLLRAGQDEEWTCSPRDLPPSHAPTLRNRRLTPFPIRARGHGSSLSERDPSPPRTPVHGCSHKTTSCATTTECATQRSHNHEARVVVPRSGLGHHLIAKGLAGTYLPSRSQQYNSFQSDTWRPGFCHHVHDPQVKRHFTRSTRDLLHLPFECFRWQRRVPSLSAQLWGGPT